MLSLKRNLPTGLKGFLEIFRLQDKSANQGSKTDLSENGGGMAILWLFYTVYAWSELPFFGGSWPMKPHSAFPHEDSGLGNCLAIIHIQYGNPSSKPETVPNSHICFCSS